MEMPKEKLDYFKNNRKFLRAKVTKLCNNISGNINSYDQNTCILNLGDLKILSDELQKSNENIDSGLWQHVTERATLDSELETCHKYKIDILTHITLLENKIKVFQDQSLHRHNPPNVTADSRLNKLHLPELPLPKFVNGEGDNLNQFFDNLEGILNKYSLSEYEKFIYLEKQLKNEPLILIKSLTGTQRSYEEAKNLLIKAFGQPVNQKFETIKKLSNLKFDQNNPFNFISEMRLIITKFSDLSIDIDSVLQYFIWSSLPKDYQTQYLHITNKIKPNLKDIEENIFEVNERVRSMSQNKFSKLESVSLAANVRVDNPTVNKNFRPCLLCDESRADHPIFKCSKYNTPSSKIEKLKELKFCIKCGGPKHFARECRFKFNKECFNCKKNGHFSYLCMNTKKVYENNSSKIKNLSSNNKIEHNENEKFNNGTCQIEFNISQINNLGHNILPTFSCKLTSGKDIRVLKDSGAQISFIKNETVSKNNFKIINDDIEVIVKGFNSQKNIKTKIVEVPIKINSNIFKICAVSIPEIATDITINGLYDLAKELYLKNYLLADKFILEYKSNNISNLDMVLGTNAFHCLPTKLLTFGDDTPSCMYETPIGNLLVGNISNMLNNLKYLSNMDKSNSQIENINNLNSTVKDINFSNTTANNNDINLMHNDQLNQVHFDEGLPSINDTGTSDTGDTKAVSHIGGDDEPYLNNKIANNEFSIINSAIYLGAIDSDYESNLNYYLNDSVLKNLHIDETQALDRKCAELLKFDDCDEPPTSEVNKNIINNTLEAIKIDTDGRLIVPILWHETNSHLLANNFRLCKQVLFSITKKVKNIPNGLKMMDEVFADQLKSGIIEKIDNVDKFIKQNPDCSFICNMPVIKMDRETTKCRIVFMSNICEKSGVRTNLTHNQTMLPGPTLNKKLLTSLLLLRFDQMMLTFDIKKAFLMLKLKPCDQNKLCFLWYNDVSNNDFTIRAFKCMRLPFGLRCSPAILMLSLYYILIYCVNDDDRLRDVKQSIYNLFYMDNGAISAKSSGELITAYESLNEIFTPFGFDLQQFYTNDDKLREQIGCSEESDEPVKLLGMFWDTQKDKLLTSKLKLDIKANTKRKILASIASNFDIFQINGPLLNRARIFMHDLQCNPKLNWDTVLDNESICTWKNISKQINDSPEISIDRYVGDRNGRYELVSCVDASKQLYGTVIYLRDIDTGKTSFLCAKNRVITKNLKNKSIPSLELLAINLGAEVLIDIYEDMCGETCVKPINVTKLHVLSDSQICLAWLQSFSNNHSKINKRSVFVQNRLNSIANICKKMPIRFAHIAGKENPADCITRCLSHKVLMKSNYYSGPDEVLLDCSTEDMSLIIPNPNITLNSAAQLVTIPREDTLHKPLLDHKNVSSYCKLVNIYSNVLKFINNVKNKVAIRKGIPFTIDDRNMRKQAHIEIIKRDQNVEFPDVTKYFDYGGKLLKHVPQLINDLNIFKDSSGLLRVKSKIASIGKCDNDFPILLSKHSHLSKIIVLDLHSKLKHSGKYVVLSEFRKKFYMSSCFSFVKKSINECIHCRRFNNRAIKLNQNSYRKFRIDPSRVPFRNLFIDHIGPFDVTISGQRTKIYLLILTCLYTRAINLKLCLDLSVQNFLRSFQLHIFEHGLPSYCISDLGSQLVAGSNIISKFLNDKYTQRYLNENNIKSVTFSQYPKGCNKLGGLVETCVKMTKRLIYGSIHNKILNYSDFEYLICETTHLVNRRPVAFKESLRDCSIKELVPTAITPEMLVKGYELISVNVIPELVTCPIDPEFDPNPTSNLPILYKKLSNVRKRLIDKYSNEFLPKLIDQATDVKGRYKRVDHHNLKIGDLVLLKETFCKPNNYPLAIVREIDINDLDEVTSVSVFKGKTRELVRRHVQSIIPLLSIEADSQSINAREENITVQNYEKGNKRPPRTAAIKGNLNNKRLVEAGLV